MGLPSSEQKERNLVQGYIYSLENFHKTLGELLNHVVLCCPVMWKQSHSYYPVFWSELNRLYRSLRL